MGINSRLPQVDRSLVADRSLDTGFLTLLLAISIHIIHKLAWIGNFNQDFWEIRLEIWKNGVLVALGMCPILSPKMGREKSLNMA